MAIRTKAEDEARLEGAGLAGEALHLAMRVAARARHEARVEAALESARRWALDRVSGLQDSAALLALLIDQQGIGGSPVDEARGRGLSTLRLPVFSGLGKGRKQASDGEAWDSAIEEAVRRLGGGPLYLPSLVLEGDVVHFALEFRGGVLTQVPASIIEEDWATSVARRVVGRVASGDDVPPAALAAANAVLNGTARYYDQKAPASPEVPATEGLPPLEEVFES